VKASALDSCRQRRTSEESVFPGEEEHDCRRRPSSGLKRIIDDTSSSSSKKKEEKAPVLNAGGRQGGGERNTNYLQNDESSPAQGKVSMKTCIRQNLGSRSTSVYVCVCPLIAMDQALDDRLSNCRINNRYSRPAFDKTWLPLSLSVCLSVSRRLEDYQLL
jgi:hypothetical protein